MQKKDQNFAKFCEFKALIDKGTSRKVNSLRSDNSGEYVSNQFKKLCAAKGIRQELTTPYNPQQNGVAERNNLNIVEEVREMLHNEGLPLHLWPEACNTTIYL